MIDLPRYDKSLEHYEGPRLPPVKAVRKHCLWCQQSPSGVRDCADTDCPLSPYRMGKISPGSSPHVLAAIHAYCHQCVEGHDEIRSCSAFVCYLPHPPCPLYPFRMGTNPNISEAKRQSLSEQAQKRPHKRDSRGHFVPGKPEK